MSYFLHAFFQTPTGIDGADEDNVGCCQILEWEVVGLGDAPRRLIVQGKTIRSAWDLKPGNRFYIVKNDPKDCQEPNGPIVWRWDEKRQDK